MKLLPIVTGSVQVLAILAALLLVAAPAVLSKYPAETAGPVFAIMADAATGCHYLVNPRGGIVPRLDAQGHHICLKGEKDA